MHSAHTVLTWKFYSFIVLVVAIALAYGPGRATLSFAQPAANVLPATYVTTAEMEAALKQMPPASTTFDKPIKTVDIGAYKVTIVILRRIPTGGVDSALIHERVTEVYQITSGAGVLETGGTLTNGQAVDLTSEAAGPSVRGTIQGGESRRIVAGDVVVIPPGLPHRYSKLEGTITYLVTRIEAPSR
jgi:mannose-6-phosphate isomerase-like protein (cupin superfamily)